MMIMMIVSSNFLQTTLACDLFGWMLSFMLTQRLSLRVTVASNVVDNDGSRGSVDTLDIMVRQVDNDQRQETIRKVVPAQHNIENNITHDDLKESHKAIIEAYKAAIKDLKESHKAAIKVLVVILLLSLLLLFSRVFLPVDAFNQHFADQTGHPSVNRDTGMSVVATTSMSVVRTRVATRSTVPGKGLTAYRVNRQRRTTVLPCLYRSPNDRKVELHDVE